MYLGVTFGTSMQSVFTVPVSVTYGTLTTAQDEGVEGVVQSFCSIDVHDDVKGCK